MLIDHLVLPTADVPALCEFWERILGARICDLAEWRDGRAEYPYMVLGEWKINVHDISAALEPVAAMRIAGSADLCLVWDGNGSAIRHLEHCGVAIELGPVDQFGHRGWGQSVYFRDPDGNLIELIEYASE